MSIGEAIVRVDVLRIFVQVQGHPKGHVRGAIEQERLIFRLNL